MAFLYTNNELSERETNEKIPFIIPKTTMTKKYLGINLTKKMKDLYLENYRTLMKEIEEDTNKWKHVHGMEELTSLKCPYYPNQSIDSTKFLLT